MNKICTCHESEKNGQTSVMCCNSCGLPDEDFCVKYAASLKEKEDFIEKLKQDIYSLYEREHELQLQLKQSIQ